MTDVATAPDEVSVDALPLVGSHTCVRVPDYDAGMAWFMEKLGFRVKTEWPGPVGVKMAYLVAKDDPRCVIELVGDGEQPSDSRTADLFASFGRGGFHHVCFTVPDINEAVSELRRRGVEIVAEPFDVAEINRMIAFIADPFGNLFELEQVV